MATTSAGSNDSTATRRQSKRPKYSKFTQQELPACKPILTPKAVISAFLIVTVVFIPIGVASLIASRDVVEIVDRYESECIPSNWTDKVAYIQSDANKTCNRELRVEKHMKSPIYVYYQLDNFYQNHRRYVKSRNDEQLRKSGKANKTSGCEPEDYVNGVPIVPCGLIAWSMFNDTYSFSRNSNNVTVNKKEISWKSDRDHKFGSNVFPKNFQNGTIIGGAHLNESIPLVSCVSYELNRETRQNRGLTMQIVATLVLDMNQRLNRQYRTRIACFAKHGGIVRFLTVSKRRGKKLKRGGKTLTRVNLQLLTGSGRVAHQSFGFFRTKKKQ